MDLFFLIYLTIVTFNWKTNLPCFDFAFDHTIEIHNKYFSDPQFNEHGYYVLGYVSIKLSNEFLKELLIETAYLNDCGYRVVEGFPFE